MRGKYIVLQKKLLNNSSHDFGRNMSALAINWLTINIFVNIFHFEVLAVQTQTLPQKISNVSIITGQITGLDKKFSNTGTLITLRDQKSIEFDAETIAKFNPEATTLVQTLNRFGLYNAGDLFNLGTLEIDADPQVKYLAPTYAIGLNDNWTFALAVPIIQYSNTVVMRQSLSNKSYYEQFRGLSPDLDAALDTNLEVATQHALINKGYDPIQNQKSDFIGDIQLINLYKFLSTAKSHFVNNLTVVLPTGPKFNPDNLLALNNFHKFSIENTISYSYLLNSFISITPFIGLKYFIPNQIIVRVAQNINDTLPDQYSKQSLTLQEGFHQEIGTMLSWSLNDDFSINQSIKYGTKSSDRYSKPTNGTTQLLENNTDQTWQRYAIEINYSMIKSYLKKQSLLPMNLNFKIYDTFSGRNIEKQQGQELTISLYF